ncbi:MAG: PAS domain-containing protein [Deltaproteobacteria bacterium]|nr:PAS domain-containing protein [Deltaproteobacteria bacterium]
MGKQRRWINSLIFKILVGFSLATLTTIMTALAISSWISREIVEKRLQSDALFVSNTLGAALPPILQKGDIAAAQRLTENIAAIPLIHEITVLDVDYKIVVSSALGQIGLLNHHAAAAAVFEMNRIHFISIGKDSYDIAIPVKGNRYIRKNSNDINWVVLARLNTEYEDLVFAYLNQAITVQSILLFLMLTVLMLALLYRFIFVPFKHLSRAAHEIESGNFSHRIGLQRFDEIGEFIDAFNHMIEAIMTREKRIIDDSMVIEEGRQRLEMAVEASEAGIWDWNIMDGSVVFSDRWVTMLGYEPDEIENHVSSWEKLLHPEDSKVVQQELNAHLEGKTAIYQTVHRLRTKSGAWRWIQDTGRVVSRGEDGTARRMLGTHVDVTSRRQNEMELTRYREQLEEMVEERTRELKEAQNELINLAIESGRAQLSAMILHNIGNAMTPVGVRVAEMKQDNPGQRISEYLRRSYEDLVAHAEHLADYVTEDERGKEVFAFMGKLIRSMSEHQQGLSDSLDKISEAVNYVSEIISLQQNYAAGKRENREMTDLNRLMEDALKMQSTAIEKRKIRVDKDLAPGLPPLIIDRNKLMQVVVNLIKNSYEAMDGLQGDAPFLAVRTFTTAGHVGLEVRDSGIGVEPERIGRIFEFGESGKGSSGFGLYYCSMFVEANMGKLDFISDGPGKGATVRLTFETRLPQHRDGNE